MKVKSNAINDFSDATRISTKEIKYGSYSKHESTSKSKDKEKKKDYSEERKRKRGE